MKLTWQQEEAFETACITFLAQDAIEWVAKNLNPEDVFDERELERWAENNGFSRD